VADLEKGLYVREKEISLKEFHTIPGSYTIKGSYKKILSVRPGELRDMVFFTLLMDPTVEENHQETLDRFPKKQAEYERMLKLKAEGKRPTEIPKPELPLMGVQVLIAKIDGETPINAYSSEIQYIGRVKDLVFFGFNSSGWPNNPFRGFFG